MYRRTDMTKVIGIFRDLPERVQQEKCIFHSLYSYISDDFEAIKQNRLETLPYFLFFLFSEAFIMSFI
jgi:hypothetical protein